MLFIGFEIRVHADLDRSEVQCLQFYGAPFWLKYWCVKMSYMRNMVI